MKNNLKKYLLIFSISLNIGFIIMAGYAVIRYRLLERGPHSRHVIHSRSFDKLDLSVEQKKQIDQRVKDYLKASTRIHTASSQQTIATYALLGEPGQPTPETLDEYLKTEKSAESEKEEIKLRHLLDIKQILTDAQAKDFFRNLAEIKQARVRKQQQNP